MAKSITRVQRTEAVVSGPDAPPARPIEDTDAEAAAALGRRLGELRALLDSPRTAAPDATTKVRAHLAEVATLQTANRGLSERLAAAAVAATQTEIAERLALMVGSLPAAGGVDPGIYARVLVAEVGALQPSVGAVTAAVRAMIRTRRFLPPVADVLAEIEKAEGSLQVRRDMLAGLGRVTSAAERFIAGDAERSRKRAGEAEATRARLREEIAKRLEAGEPLGVLRHHRELVAEVEAERNATTAS